MKQEKIYKIAVRKKSSPNDFFWEQKDFQFEECSINTAGKYWLADPFVFEKDGGLYIFFEAFDLVNSIGKIGYSKRLDNGTFTHPKIIIDKKYHMSFPHIFEYEGDIFIMPESCGDWRVRLFKAKLFPDIWEEADILLPDVYACDSIIIDAKDRKWLLTNEMYHNPPVDSYVSCWVKNYLYEMNGLKIINSGTKVAEGDFGIRNAGKSFWLNNRQYRVGQDCRNKQYGRGLALFEIESFVPYKEKMLWSKDCKDIAPHIKRHNSSEIIGVHTYNGSEHWEVIDYSHMSCIPFNLKMKRLHRLIRIAMAPFFRKFKSN